MRDASITDLLEIIAHAIELALDRYAELEDLNLSISSDKAIMVLDSIAMRLILIGEKIKNIEQKDPGFFIRNSIDPRPVIRTRDYLSHHYEDVDFDAIVLICKKHLPDLFPRITALLAKP